MRRKPRRTNAGALGLCLIVASCEPGASEGSEGTVRQELIAGAPMTVEARLIEKSGGRWQLACMGRFRNLGVGDTATYAAHVTFFQEGAQTALISGQVTPATPTIEKSALGAQLTMSHPSAVTAGSLTVRMVRGPVDPKRHHACQVVIKRNGTEVMRTIDRPARLSVKPSATFPSGTSFFTETHAAAMGDLDGDGDLDVISGSSGYRVIVMLNDGKGLNWSDNGQTFGNHATWAVALGDLDGDGDLDLFQGNLAQANRVWMNNGSGRFTSNTQSLGAHQTTSVALGDVDGDGDIDAVEGNGTGQANRIWRNNGTGAFTDSGQLLGNHATYAVALGDLDGDGDLDLFEGNLDQANRVWRNNGTGVFTNSGQLLGNHATTAVALGDLDGDGDLDAFEGTWNDQPDRVWRNDGTGVFPGTGEIVETCHTLPCVVPETRTARAVSLGDLDGDGDLDAFVGNYLDVATEVSRLWLNDGTGLFTDSGQGLGAQRAVALGDLDSDGDLDIFAGGALGSGVALNQ